MLCIIFGTAGRIRMSGPRGASTTKVPWQAAVSLDEANAQADPRVRPSNQQKTTHGSWWLDARVTRISRVMTRPDPQDVQNS